MLLGFGIYLTNSDVRTYEVDYYDPVYYFFPISSGVDKHGH